MKFAIALVLSMITTAAHAIDYETTARGVGRVAIAAEKCPNIFRSEAEKTAFFNSLDTVGYAVGDKELLRTYIARGYLEYGESPDSFCFVYGSAIKEAMKDFGR